MPVNLTWVDENSAETAHRVFRSLTPMDPNSLPAPLVELPKDTTEFIDNSTGWGETYYYRVAAVAGGNEVVSEEASITTPTLPDETLSLRSRNDLELGEYSRLLLSGDAQGGTDKLKI